MYLKLEGAAEDRSPLIFLGLLAVADLPHAAAYQVAGKTPGQPRNASMADENLGVAAHPLSQITAILQFHLSNVEARWTDPFQILLLHQSRLDRGRSRRH